MSFGPVYQGVSAIMHQLRMVTQDMLLYGICRITRTRRTQRNSGNPEARTAELVLYSLLSLLPSTETYEPRRFMPV